MSETELKCPHCGLTYRGTDVPWNLKSMSNLVPEHFFPVESSERCPGSWQIPRLAESDHRPLWKDEVTL